VIVLTLAPFLLVIDIFFEKIIQAIATLNNSLYRILSDSTDWRISAAMSMVFQFIASGDSVKVNAIFTEVH
jgi:hypothetical protein